MSAKSGALVAHAEPELEPLGDGSDVAKMAKVSERTVQTWTYSRKIPSIKIGRARRYNLDAVRKALAKFTIEEVH
jgi:excisionase family DNA binding protein